MSPATANGEPTPEQSQALQDALNLLEDALTTIEVGVRAAREASAAIQALLDHSVPGSQPGR